MNNQHAGLSQLLAEERIDELRGQAAHAWLLRGGRYRRQQRTWVARHWWQLARWPGVATVQPGSRTPTSS
jgi:hypothetical protein